MGTIGRSNGAKINNFRQITGLVLILAGGMLFLDRYLKTGWLSMLILPALGFFLYFWGIRAKHKGLILAGGLIGAIGAGGLAAWGPSVRLGGIGTITFAEPPNALWLQIGLLALYLGIGWGVIALTTGLVTPPPALWALVPGGVLFGLGYAMLFTQHAWTDFAISLGLGIGIPLLIWGLLDRLFGLIIPACILIGAGLGVYFAWRSPVAGNGLTQTGILLAYLALGWGLMTLFARWITHHYIWWPLIPGGIFAVVGIGLYIGGDPYHAMGFISNTGGIALMIFGLYLLLMRKGIHH